jgi:hypothetical protein
MIAIMGGPQNKTKKQMLNCLSNFHIERKRQGCGIVKNCPVRTTHGLYFSFLRLTFRIE